MIEAFPEWGVREYELHQRFQLPRHRASPVSVNFDRAFAIVVGLEAGYVSDPQDPDGETKYGISKRAYPQEDIPTMTLQRAQFLYSRDHWAAHGLDDLEYRKALIVFARE